MNLIIDNRIKQFCPEMQIGIIRCNVKNSPTPDALWSELEDECNIIKSTYKLLEINKRPAIAKNRELYKHFGKDPNRYRISSEALCRRIIRGLELYRINTLVDLINLASIKSGYAIGGFDADKIVGNTLNLTIGEHLEKFEAIGRGQLNIEGLPIYRDQIGGIGTPTSDEERTKISLATSHIHININAFATEFPLAEMIDWTIMLLTKYAQADNIEYTIIKNSEL
ncbi:MAG: phenylalanine--tRNA ligase beta subunit-related protein [Muribaculaceae bacterium]|nr:phenylalanine--tRNA ligase beta subunit-related protein [Muribaculaceae bacterium]